jgi:hypothetical protein
MHTGSASPSTNVWFNLPLNVVLHIMVHVSVFAWSVAVVADVGKEILTPRGPIPIGILYSPLIDPALDEALTVAYTCTWLSNFMISTRVVLPVPSVVLDLTYPPAITVYSPTVAPCAPHLAVPGKTLHTPASTLYTNVCS